VPALLTNLLKDANTVEEAVTQFYENPNKYSHSAAPSTSIPVNLSKEAKTAASAPPPYASMRAIRHRPHTNAVIEAGHVRARDEVRFNFASGVITN
jgi:hypothetical protein